MPFNSPPAWTLAIADDLTGALEAGAKFSSAGYFCSPRVTSGPRMDASGVCVFDTESRHLSPSEAALRVRRIAGQAKLSRPWLIYKKTDSTLRGNIAAELHAVAEVFPERKILFVPAYPAMGRSVRGGELLVHGVSVHQTAFAQDPLNPIHSSAVAAFLGDLPASVLDGQSEEDVRQAARLIVPNAQDWIVAGPAAIAAAIAALLPQQSASIPLVPRRCLVINGSLHPQSQAQIEHGVRAGCFDSYWSLYQHEGPETGLARAQQIGLQVRQILTNTDFEAIIVFGGDTAFGIHVALGAVDFTCVGEILPGVPVSRSQGLLWVTKAGGFGNPDLLERLKYQP